MENSLNFLGKRAGFNIALRHFKGVTAMIKKFEAKTNLAQIINQQLEEKGLSSFQVSSIINALLVDKYQYLAVSNNIKITYVKPLAELATIVKNWTAFDIVVIYHHPQLGAVLINPKDPESWGNVDSLRENELVVVYCGNFQQAFDAKLAKKCADELIKLMNSEISNSTMQFNLESTPTPSAEPITKPTASTPTAQKSASVVKTTVAKKKKMSPQYGVTVTNELFHNGNVEAWKRIIRSYENKYPEIKVLVFYEGEQIHDINTLFKWGKVKHGTNIYICLLGPEFVDISKLRRYLSQGASSRFEDFLKGDPTKDMALF